jgi:ABC-type phosphate transport system permease subunit
MARRRARRTIYLVLAVSLLALLLESVAVILLGANTPAWAHWLCSPSAIHSARHALLGGGLDTALKTSLKLLAVHWPHLVPIPLGIATLVYLYRSNTRYNTNRPADTTELSLT